jgi:hypothetical protein
MKRPVEIAAAAAALSLIAWSADREQNLRKEVPMTHKEFVSLRDCAKGLMHRTIPAEHKDRLIQLGYIQELSGGLRLSNAGRLRIAEGI